MTTRVVLHNVRLSFPDLFEAVQYQGKGAFSYKATFLVAPGSANDKKIEAAIQTEATAEYGKKAAAKLALLAPQPQKYCYRDGEEKEYDGYEGVKFLGAKRKQNDGPPAVIDEAKRQLSAASGKVYGGCYVNASVDIYAQSGENEGIRCSLIGVQFCADGDSFGGASAANTDDFEETEAGADAEALG